MHADVFVYNEKTGKGFATKKALLKDYSQGDTLFMHADSLKIETMHINTDSAYRKVQRLLDTWLLIEKMCKQYAIRWLQMEKTLV